MSQVKNNPGVNPALVQQQQPTAKPQGQGRIGTANSAQAAEGAFARVEAGRTSAAALSSLTSTQTASALGGSVKAESALGQSTAAAFMGKTVFNLGALGIEPNLQVASGLDNTNLPSPKGQAAQQTQLGAAMDFVKDARGQQKLQLLGTLTSAATAMAEQAKTSDPKFKEAIALTMKAAGQLSTTKSNQEVKEEALNLNGENGKVFGDFASEVVNRGNAMGMNFSAMSVEDACLMMMFLISDDAQKDVKDLLSEMDATRLRKSAERKKETLMREEKARLEGEARKIYEDMTPEQKEAGGFKDFETFMKSVQVQTPVIETNPNTGEATIGVKGKLIIGVVEPTKTPADGGTTPTTADGATTPPPGGDATTPPPGGDATTPPPGGDATTPPPGGDATTPPPGGGATTPPPGGGIGGRFSGVDFTVQTLDPSIIDRIRDAAGRRYMEFEIIPGGGIPGYPGCDIGGDNYRQHLTDIVNQTQLGSMTLAPNVLNQSTIVNAGNVLNQSNLANTGNFNAAGALNTGNFNAAGALNTGNFNAGANMNLGNQFAFQEGALAQTGATGSTSSNQAADAPNETSGGQVGTFEQFGVSIDKVRDQKDAQSELNESQQLRLQMYMDRLTKADSLASNLMKKFSDTLNQVIGNMK